MFIHFKTQQINPGRLYTSKLNRSFTKIVTAETPSKTEILDFA